MAKIEFLDPTMSSSASAHELAPRVETVNGKTVGLRVQWTRFELFMDRFEELLQERYQPEGIVRISGKTAGKLMDKAGMASPRAEEFFQKADWAVLGLAA